MSRTPDLTVKIQLLRASEQVFAARGLALAKVEEITRRAGTSKGAFLYLHFASKEEAFQARSSSRSSRGSHRSCRWWKGARPSFRASLPTLPTRDESLADALAFWRSSTPSLYEFLGKNRAIVSILQGCQGDHVYLLEAFHKEISARTIEWIGLWKELAYFRAEIDVDPPRRLLVGAHNELARKMVTSTARPPIADWVRKTQAVFVRGFGTEALVAALAGESENPEGAPAPEQFLPRRPLGRHGENSRSASSRTALRPTLGSAR